MRRLPGILLNTAAALSLVVCAATVALWIRGRLGPPVSYRGDGPGATTTHAVQFTPAGLEFQRRSGDDPVIRPGVDFVEHYEVSRWDGPGLSVRRTISLLTTWNPATESYRQVGGPIGHSRLVRLSLRLPFLATLPLALFACVKLLRRWRRRRNDQAARAHVNTCPRCGRDYSATSDSCPECGQQSPAKT